MPFASRLRLVVHLGPCSQITVYKGETPRNTRASRVFRLRTGSDTVAMTLERIQCNRAYLEHLFHVLDCVRSLARDFAAYERICRSGTLSDAPPTDDGLVALPDVCDPFGPAGGERFTMVEPA